MHGQRAGIKLQNWSRSTFASYQKNKRHLLACSVDTPGWFVVNRAWSVECVTECSSQNRDCQLDVGVELSNGDFMSFVMHFICFVDHIFKWLPVKD